MSWKDEYNFYISWLFKFEDIFAGKCCFCLNPRIYSYTCEECAEKWDEIRKEYGVFLNG